MSFNVCKSINDIDNYFVDDPNSPGEHNSRNLLNSFFSDSNCSSDEENIISGFILLLSLFNDINDKNIDGDKLVEYGILWLSYKLNQKKQNGTTKLDDFYIKNIEKNSCYNDNIAKSINNNGKINKDVIEKKIKSMNIDIKDISNYYDPLKSLCNVYSEFDPEKIPSKTCLENAGEFFEKYEKHKNALDITKGDSYSQLWFSLLKDYKMFENTYSVKCGNPSSFIDCSRCSVTKNTLITIAIIFVAASILLGVSYKYSLFGFRKRSQKQHLRELLKK
ncbi:PIR protein [Plasmodium yoelii]|uniref:PIR protein n=2 Tax=Plasmodium yoelii TaxID=5861 RepID=A0AAE9WXH8_PLAYO|nr:PIR protein [Plasmodium yoelii]WBY58352.1 PIR protein [Plasmodium yoelii yoelii]CDS44425.1 YIR protein [Plasmodium yoelii]VTZ79268.1 PIR protein [Plasmodium yoelii]|eukprot:XP_022810673.1 PIR protein [Plasmodium yoelii]